ncbi:MAG: hypothetical protein KME14_12825 [Tildeniella torsiva UHER 1998/13D]|nr:hypothetical protein [Tildeniella torsiva UHER 1998/13D]
MAQVLCSIYLSRLAIAVLFTVLMVTRPHPTLGPGADRDRTQANSAGATPLTNEFFLPTNTTQEAL